MHFDRARQSVNPFYELIAGIFDVIFGFRQLRDLTDPPTFSLHLAGEAISSLDSTPTLLGLILPMALDKFEERVSELLLARSRMSGDPIEYLANACRSFDRIAESVLGAGRGSEFAKLYQAIDVLRHASLDRSSPRVELSEDAIERAKDVIHSLGGNVYHSARQFIFERP